MALIATTSARSLPRADVLILGAGPAGTIAALNLAAQYRVLLVDRVAVPANRIGESLPPACRRLLADMGLFEEFLEQAHSPCYGNRAIWGGPLTEHDFLSDPDGNGWHLDRARFESWLRCKAVERGAALIAPANVTDVAATESGWRAVLVIGGQTHSVDSTVVIDASGRNAVFAKKHGARRQRQDRLISIWCYGADHATLSDGRSFIEACAEGWWYSAVLPEQRRVLALHTDSDLPAAKALRQPGALLRAASQLPALGPLLTEAGFSQDSAIKLAAAHSAVLNPGAGINWFAVGDAALSFDPLSAQGLFNALYTGLAAAEASDRALRGDVRASADYNAELHRIAQAYRHHLRYWYGQERRWPEAPFWRRRHGLAAE